MARIWRVVAPEHSFAERLTLPLPNVAATLLANRGVSTIEQVESFLSPSYDRDLHDPYLFRDMRRVVGRIGKAIRHRESVAVFADYDADGVCSAALLVSTLTALDARVHSVYLPHREREGYGLNRQAVAAFVAAGVRLLITLDCGTTNQEEVLLAKGGGIDVIVIDHHHVPAELPGAYALLNPKMPDEAYPFRHLASVGMAFKTAQALLQQASVDEPSTREHWRKFAEDLLDFVAIATVTDLVPLVGENRALVSLGLATLNQTKRAGLRSVVEAMGGELGQLDTYSIGYHIGPRLNAAGRMNHANAAYELLVSPDQAVGRRLARELEASNRERQQLTERITVEAKESIEPWLNDRVLIAVGDDWPVGVVGLVASRLLEQYHRPVLVVGRTAHGLTGSGRSIPAFNIIAALHQMPELFTKFGGHAQACGFTLASEAVVVKLREYLNALASSLTADELQPVLTIDAALRLRDVQEPLADLVQALEPYGMGNPKPKFLFAGVRIVGLSTVGSNGQHLRLSLTDGQGTIRSAIGFNHGRRSESLTLGDELDVVAEVTVNAWNGRRELQLKVLDLRPAVR